MHRIAVYLNYWNWSRVRRAACKWKREGCICCEISHLRDVQASATLQLDCMSTRYNRCDNCQVNHLCLTPDIKPLLTPPISQLLLKSSGFLFPFSLFLSQLVCRHYDYWISDQLAIDIIYPDMPKLLLFLCHLTFCYCQQQFFSCSLGFYYMVTVLKPF